MTEAEIKEQMQSAQDLVDSVIEQRTAAHNALAQMNAVRRAEQRQVETLKAELQTAVNKVAELEERLSKAVMPVEAMPLPNGNIEVSGTIQ